MQRASLPTIMIFERHWDLIPKQVLIEMLPVFAAEGYDTFCMEAPSSLTEEKIIARNKHYVDVVSGLFTKATELLTRANAMPAGKLEDLGLDSLSKLMLQHVSSQRYLEVSEMIKQLPAAKLIQQILSIAGKLAMTLKGIDVEDEIYAAVSMGNLDKRAAAIDAAEDARIACFVENLLKAREVCKGTIAICGASHISKLLAKFKEEKVDTDFHCYFAHSNKFYGDTFDDLEKLKEAYPELKECSTCLGTAEEVHLFAQKILATAKKRQ